MQAWQAPSGTAIKGTSITQNVERHFREAVRTIPTTKADFDADGNLTEEAFRKIADQAMDIVCAADLEEAEKTGLYPVPTWKLRRSGFTG